MVIEVLPLFLVIIKSFRITLYQSVASCVHRRGKKTASKMLFHVRWTVGASGQKLQQSVPLQLIMSRCRSVAGRQHPSVITRHYVTLI